jgi:nucleotide-binding universal stress UspA family protein
MFRHILFPVDFSEQSRAVAPFVLSLARQFGSRVTLLNVIPPPPPVYSDMGTPFPIDFHYAEAESGLTHRLGQLACAELPRVEIDCAVEIGDAALEIADYADRTRADLIAMPTHGYGVFRRMLLGSTAAKVFHDADVPVWTSPHAPEPFHRARPQPKMILALDQTRETAGALAEETGAKLEVVSERDATGPAIRRLVLDKLVDLLVIGRTTLKAQAYDIVREAPCPVLSV